MKLQGHALQPVALAGSALGNGNALHERGTCCRYEVTDEVIDEHCDEPKLFVSASALYRPVPLIVWTVSSVMKLLSSSAFEFSSADRAQLQPALA